MPQPTPTQYHTLVISDLHLGTHICRTDKILTVLNTIPFKNLIINGDLFDSNTTSKFTTAHWEVISKISAIADRGNVLLVGGNHGRKLDSLAEKMGITIVDHHTFALGEKRFLCLHGDEFDMYIKNLPLTSKLFTEIYYIIQRFGGKRQNVSIIIKRLSKQILGVSRRQQRLALRHGRSHDADVIICSHTHIPHSSTKDGVLFINSGSFCDNLSTYITIEKNGTVKLNDLLPGLPLRSARGFLRVS